MNLMSLKRGEDEGSVMPKGMSRQVPLILCAVFLSYLGLLCIDLCPWLLMEFWSEGMYLLSQKVLGVALGGGEH